MKFEETGDRRIDLAIHRIVHGGLFPGGFVLNQETVRETGLLTDLAPLYESRFVEVYVWRANVILLSLEAQATLVLFKLVTQQLLNVVNIAHSGTTFCTRNIPPHVYISSLSTTGFE